MKIICSDFDGTLCRGGIISDADREAIDGFRSRGNLFGIVTGRGIRSIHNALESKNFRADFIVANNGALICDADGGISRDFPVSGEILPDFCAWIENYGVPYLVVDSFEKEIFAPNEGYNKFQAFHQISIAQKTVSEASEMIKKMHLEWGGYIFGHQNGTCIDITRTDVSKSTGVGCLAELYNAERECIFTVGDQMNDYPMVRDYRGYAVEGAALELKKAADGVVPDMTELIKIAES